MISSHYNGRPENVGRVRNDGCRRRPARPGLAYWVEGTAARDKAIMADNKPEIDRVEVEVFSNATNHWIIRTPGRAFPAMVIQGDSFSILVRGAERLLHGVRAVSSPDSELVDQAEMVCELLQERLKDYEAVLHQHGIELPYRR